MTTTIRVSEETRDRVRELASESGQSMQTVVEQAFAVYHRERFFAALDAAYDKLWRDPVERELEMAERAIFEGTLADGLIDDPGASA